MHLQPHRTGMAYDRFIMDGGLVFLTSTSKAVPSGRNAKVVARASMVRQNAPSTSARGTFNVFLTQRKHEEKKIGQNQNLSLLNPLAGQQSHHASKRRVPLQQCTKDNPRRKRKKTCQKEDIPHTLGPQSISIRELLTTATARIRHDLTLTLKRQPSRVRDALRRRQWAAAAFALDTLQLTPEVHSAISYLEQKVLITDRSARPHEIELQKYAIALSELQQSLRDPERRMQPSVLAASHILAICEMLDDTTSDNYLKFVNGIVSLSNLHVRKGDYYARNYVCFRAGAIMVEALLTKRHDLMLDQPWPQLLASAGNKGQLSQGDSSSFADSAELIFSGRPLTRMSIASQMMESDKMVAAAKARRLHTTIKQSVLSELQAPSKAKYICPRAEILAERVAVMLGLDDFVSQIAGDADPSELVHHVKCSFYADAICGMEIGVL